MPEALGDEDALAERVCAGDSVINTGVPDEHMKPDGHKTGAPLEQ